MVQQPLCSPETGAGAGILFSGHRDRRDAPPPDGQPAGAHRRTGGLLPLRGRLPTDRRADQQRHRQMCAPAPPSRRASARPPAPRDAEKIPPAPQGRRRPGHPLPCLRGGGLRGAAAAHLRRAAGLAAGHRADEEPRRSLHWRAHAKGRRLPLLGRSSLFSHRRTAAGRGRDPDRYGGRDLHEPAPAGRRGQRKDAGGRCGHLGLYPGRVSGSASGAYRNSGQPARREPEPPAFPLRDAGGPAHRRDEGCPAPHHPRRHPERRSRPHCGHPRHPQRGRGLRPAGACRRGRAAPLRRPSAGPAGRKGREPPPVGHERHPHSPDTGASDVRRP